MHKTYRHHNQQRNTKPPTRHPQPIKWSISYIWTRVFTNTIATPLVDIWEWNKTLYFIPLMLCLTTLSVVYNIYGFGEDSLLALVEDMVYIIIQPVCVAYNLLGAMDADYMHAMNALSLVWVDSPFAMVSVLGLCVANALYGSVYLSIALLGLSALMFYIHTVS